MAIVRDIEPWDALLDARPRGRAARPPGAPARALPGTGRAPGRAAPGRGGRAARAAASTRCGATRPRPVEAAYEATTIVTTGTASGKSLCFQLPTLDVLSRDARARALFLYPSKALAQDQARSLHALGVKRARPAIYDGDTPREQRADAAPAGQRRS